MCRARISSTKRRCRRIPRARAIPEGLRVLVDNRECYPYGFAGRQVESQRVALPAGDYAVARGEEMIATVERKTFENLVASLSDGTLAFQMQRLGEVARAAVVVEGRYSALFKLEHVPSAFIADGLARLQVRYPEIPVAFADLRKFAEEWTYRLVGANASAVVACGRTLEAAADARKMTGKTLRDRVTKMQNEGLITTEFKSAMSYVRLIRNIGAHAGRPVRRESAEGTMRFTQQALRLLFEVPAELGRLTAPPPEELDEESDGENQGVSG